MTGWHRHPASDDSLADPLAVYRTRVMQRLGIVGVLFLLPFSINDFIQGRHALAAAVLVVVATLGINVVAIQRRRAPPIPFALLLIPMILGVSFSVRLQGIYGALWFYPLLLFCYFVLPRRLANASALLLLAIAGGMVLRHLGAGVTVRFLVSVTLTMVIINIMLGILGDLQRKLQDQAITDPLTGAFNRRHMDTCLAEALERNARFGTPASLLLIDIDHFKRINDRFGHGAGDAVLQAVVTGITGGARRLDRLFRLGGEEFMLLLPDTRAEDAVVLAHALRRLVASTSAEQSSAITISVGVSELVPGEDAAGWMRRADAALYQAKQSGRDCVRGDAVAGSCAEPLLRLGCAG